MGEWGPVEIDIPMALRISPIDPQHPARAAILYGPAVLAQDEATSTVWGMPGSVAKAGLAQAVLPLPEIGPALRSLITGQPA